MGPAWVAGLTSNSSDVPVVLDHVQDGGGAGNRVIEKSPSVGDSEQPGVFSGICSLNRWVVYQ